MQKKISETYASNEKVENFVSHEQMREKVQQVEQAAIYGAKMAIETYGLPKMDFATAEDIDDLF